jgi:hypothetical protein
MSIYQTFDAYIFISGLLTAIFLKIILMGHNVTHFPYLLKKNFKHIL